MGWGEGYLIGQEILPYTGNQWVSVLTDFWFSMVGITAFVTAIHNYADSLAEAIHSYSLYQLLLLFNIN